MTIVHRPVLLDEVVEVLARPSGGLPQPRFVDCTLGGAGHSEALLEAVPDSELLGLDRDPEAVERCKQRLERFRDRVELCLGDYRELAEFIEKKTGPARWAASSPTSASRVSSSTNRVAASRSVKTVRSTCGSTPRVRFQPPRISSRTFRKMHWRSYSAVSATNRTPAGSPAASSSIGASRP
jgi:hypothetical protein